MYYTSIERFPGNLTILSLIIIFRLSSRFDVVSTKLKSLFFMIQYPLNQACKREGSLRFSEEFSLPLFLASLLQACPLMVDTLIIGDCFVSYIFLTLDFRSKNVLCTKFRRIIRKRYLEE